jgi:thiol:disulfide interchange protein DsbA
MLRRASALIAGALMSVAAAATHADELGYELIDPAQNTSVEAGQVEVIEFFWYGCPHCYRLEPSMQAWLEEKPENVVFKRVAPPLNKNWENHARAFYAAEALGVTEKLHQPLFDALHKDKKRLFDKDDLADFAAEQGIDRDKFRKTMDSFAVSGQLNRATQLARAYRLGGVPAVVVDGKYKTSGTLAGTYPRMVEIIDELAKEELAGK